MVVMESFFGQPLQTTLSDITEKVLGVRSEIFLILTLNVQDH